MKKVNKGAPEGAGHILGCPYITLQLSHTSPASAFKTLSSLERISVVLSFASLPSHTMSPRRAAALDWWQDTCAHYITGRAQAVVVCTGEAR